MVISGGNYDVEEAEQKGFVPKPKKFTVSEAKELFKQHHPEESKILEGSLSNKEFHIHAECVWHGFKSALKVTGLLDEVADLIAKEDSAKSQINM